MKQALLYLLVGLLLLGNVFWAACFFRERAAYNAVPDVPALPTKIVQVTNVQLVALVKPEPAGPTMETVAGVYTLDIPYEKTEQSLDLRSDGDARIKPVFNERWYPCKWELQGDNVTLSGRTHFRVEGNDLIDRKGYRWLRQR